MGEFLGDLETGLGLTIKIDDLPGPPVTEPSNEDDYPLVFLCQIIAHLPSAPKNWLTEGPET